MTTGAQDTVERMIGEGLPFEEIEQYIETLALSDAQLGALWLLAWAEAADPLTRRKVVAEALAGDDHNHFPAPLLAATPGSSARAPHDERRLQRRVRSDPKRWERERRRAR